MYLETGHDVCVLHECSEGAPPCLCEACKNSSCYTSQQVLCSCRGNDVVPFVSQIAMQNQINTNPESPDTVTIHAATPQFIIGPGGVVNLTGLVPSANPSYRTGI